MEEKGGSRDKPDGGFRFLTAGQLCLAWSLYRERRIRYVDLRAYFACHEVAARRCVVGRGRAPEFRFAEVARLLGGGGEEAAKASVRRLAAAGLLEWTATQLSFAVSPEQLGENSLDGFWAMYRAVPNNARRVPVPRRMLRFLAGGARQTVVATVLGHLLRCLYFRNGRCEPVGTCKASWIAAVFGVDERNVHTARAHLEGELGWLVPLSSPQWHQNRYGKTVAVNLAWSRETRGENPPAAPAKTPPRAVETPVGSPPPDSDRELSSRLENQKPARAADPVGFSIEVEATKPPTLRQVVSADLQDTGRVLQLFAQAVKRGFVQETERERLNFVAAAEHARVIGSKNPSGLFYWLVSRRRWEFLTEGDDHAAHRRLKLHLFGDPRPPRAVAPSAAVELSADARFVRAVRQVARNQGLDVDPFVAAEKTRPEWTRARWDAAASELDGSAASTNPTSIQSIGSLLAGFRKA